MDNNEIINGYLNKILENVHYLFFYSILRYNYDFNI